MTSAAPPSRWSRTGMDPRSLPYESAADGLQPLAGELLEAQAMRLRFRAGSAHWEPAQRGDRLPRPDQVLRPASVLIPVLTRSASASVLLTRRTEHMRKHSGQVAFPGGRSEPGDRDSIHTALREAQEEVGLDPAQVEVLGVLPDYVTGTGYQVTPVVALVNPLARLCIDPDEVAEAFEVPLAFLMDPANHRRHAYLDDGVRRQFLSMPYGADLKAISDQYFIWGATAAMIRNLYHFLSGN